jgi:hypothetical protein
MHTAMHACITGKRWVHHKSVELVRVGCAEVHSLEVAHLLHLDTRDTFGHACERCRCQNAGILAKCVAVDVRNLTSWHARTEADHLGGRGSAVGRGATHRPSVQSSQLRSSPGWSPPCSPRSAPGSTPRPAAAWPPPPTRSLAQTDACGCTRPNRS